VSTRGRRRDARRNADLRHQPDEVTHLPHPLLTDELKALLPPLGSTDGVPSDQRRVPVVLEGSNGWVWYLLEGGEVEYGYECFAIVDGIECEAGAVPIEVNPEYGEEDGLDYHARRGLVWRREGHDPNTTLSALKAGELGGKVHF
jgi:hypothetical protein